MAVHRYMVRLLFRPHDIPCGNQLRIRRNKVPAHTVRVAAHFLSVRIRHQGVDNMWNTKPPADASSQYLIVRLLQTIDRGALNEWWKGRSIPASRSGIQDALTELCIPSTQLLMEKCLGFSLSDQYWICPAGSGLSWEQANFFENPFSKDVGDILFGRGADGGNINLMSPDNTSDGWLKKKWLVLDGKRFLLKGGSIQCQFCNWDVLMHQYIGYKGFWHRFISSFQNQFSGSCTFYSRSSFHSHRCGQQLHFHYNR